MSKPRYWTTLPELQGSPAVEKLRQEEFKSKPQEHFDAVESGKEGLRFGRRDFMKWSTAALAVAATACSRKPVQQIIPYAQQPPDITPGIANYYASTCRECAAGCGIVLTTHEGRPTKVEGNPLHPLNHGTACPIGQAALLNLYDPDRLRQPVALDRVHSLAGLVGNAPQPKYRLHFPTNVWKTGTPFRNNQHPILRALNPITWDAADKQVGAWLGAAGSRGVLLTGTIHGPARTALLADFLSVYPLRHVVYDSINPDAVVAGQAAAYGAPARPGATPRYFFDRAEMIVTFGADPIGSGISRQEYSWGFGHQRKLRGNTMSRVVAFEPAMSLVGLSADTRYLLPPSQLLPAALALAHQLVLVNKVSRFAGDATVAKALAPFEPAAVEHQTGLPAGALGRLAGELWQQRGKSIVCGGGMAGATEDQVMLELAVAFLNSALENEGATIDGTGSPSLQAQGSNAAMLQLIQDMQAGKVETLFVYGTNPAYSLPEAAGFLPALAKVPHVVVLAERLDETAQLGNLALPALHGMESWGDAEPQAGLYSLVQPTIEPLFGGRSFEDALIQLAYLTPAGKAKFTAPPPPAPPVLPPAPGAAATPALSAAPAAGAAAAAAAAAPPTPPQPPAVAYTFYGYLREHWQTQIYPKNNPAASFDDFWTGALQAGVFDPNPKRRQPGAARAFKTAALAALPSAASAPAAAGELELSLAVPPMLGDGWWGNNAFLLEIPDPVWKSCWDNFFTIAPSTAKQLGLEPDSDETYAVAEATVGNATLRAPVYVQIGVHPGVAAIYVGYGRASVGEVGTDVGANAYRLAQLAPGGQGIVPSGSKVTLRKVGGRYLIASPQGNNYASFNSDTITPEQSQGRAATIVRDTTLVQIQANPSAGNPPQEPPASLWDNGGPSEHTYPTYHWGMTIDLNACIGCNACAVACYAENNVPVVGKDQVWRGREMAWIRIDRYFSGPEDNPDVTQLPMLCQQCANAGCESVCPVIATVTDAEGLNVQVYNRCVGTRFCSNNCIYKVRRFNFYNYSTVRAAPLELALNPLVTVRSRGIMEKCTFCVQRIHAAHYRAKERGLPVRDGDIRTACQQTCPAQAIYFGNMDDKNSVMMRQRSARGYKVLEELNFQPSIVYLTKVRNLGAGDPEAKA